MLEAQDYLYGIALGGGLVLLMLAPVIYAGIVAFWPGQRPARKLLFAVVCGLLAYGAACLTYVLLTPIELIAIYFAPNWQDQGWETIPKAIGIAAQAIDAVSLTVGVLVALAVPIHIRRNVWAKIYPPVPTD